DRCADLPRNRRCDPSGAPGPRGGDRDRRDRAGGLDLLHRRAGRARRAGAHGSGRPPPRGETYFNVYTTAPISSSEGPLNVYIYASANTSGGELVPTASISFGDPAGGAVADYMPVSDPNAGIELEPGSTVTSGSL